MPANNNDLWKYAGLATQIFAVLGIMLFIGMKADAWLNIGFPLLVWLLPLLAIISIINKIIKDTSKK